MKFIRVRNAVQNVTWINILGRGNNSVFFSFCLLRPRLLNAVLNHTFSLYSIAAVCHHFSPRLLTFVLPAPIRPHTNYWASDAFSDSINCGERTCHVITSWSGCRLSVQTAAGLRNGTVGGVRQAGVEYALGSLQPSPLRARIWNVYSDPGTNRTRTNSRLPPTLGTRRYGPPVPRGPRSRSVPKKVML